VERVLVTGVLRAPPAGGARSTGWMTVKLRHGDEGVGSFAPRRRLVRQLWWCKLHRRVEFPKAKT
jgi:hypothetical protein